MLFVIVLHALSQATSLVLPVGPSCVRQVRFYLSLSFSRVSRNDAVRASRDQSASLTGRQHNGEQHVTMLQFSFLHYAVYDSSACAQFAQFAW